MKTCTKISAAAMSLVFATTSANAGGLADAIVEQPPAVIEEVARNGMPAWLLPTVGLVVIGALVSSSDGGDDDPATSSVPPTDLEVK